MTVLWFCRNNNSDPKGDRELEVQMSPTIRIQALWNVFLLQWQQTTLTLFPNRCAPWPLTLISRAVSRPCPHPRLHTTCQPGGPLWMDMPISQKASRLLLHHCSWPLGQCPLLIYVVTPCSPDWPWSISQARQDEAQSFSEQMGPLWLCPLFPPVPSTGGSLW